MGTNNFLGGSGTKKSKSIFLSMYSSVYVINTVTFGAEFMVI
jgi:hypothetical protein